ncbi:hypothetical protein B5X24_HaOG209006 [Helicoverpa armigera]|uniref:Tyr recombinase domain-containing protein n=1 Tax=Helicoverpa armigera TaxID=29058 RepID=A0A2W1BEU2_HELAM|nr:hypothetical protein B5X24_HaOG209006 [Helicoverpa armigera]
MSSVGRGRGYTGRHHLREPRPGDDADSDAARTLAELSPRSTDPTRMEVKRDGPALEPDKETPDKETPEEDSSLKDMLRVDDQYVPLLTLALEPDKEAPEEDSSLKDMLRVDDQYVPLLTLLEQFSPGEDGIQFNRKLRHFETTVCSMCPDETRLQQAFSTFRAAALLNPVTARKLAAVGASFTRQQRQQLLRAELLNVVMQGTFSKLDVLERSNPLFLINAANLMGDYFADLCLNKFLPLPNTLQQFYAAHLELTTEENFSEVSYGSWKKSPEKDDFRSETTEIAEKVSQNISQISLNNNEDTKPKLRPILGAGAGLLRQEQALSVSQDNFETWTAKNNLNKRYDLNSWRQQEEEKKEEIEFNQTVLPNVQNFPVPDYPPPNHRFNYPENFVNYLQQGDGTYIQNQYTNVAFNQQGGDTFQSFPERTPSNSERPPVVERVNERTPVPTMPERVNNEIQKNSSRRPIENWRKEKNDVKDDPNRNRQRNWTRQKSKDNVSEDEDKEKYKDRSTSRNRDGRARMNRRSSGEEEGQAKTPPRRHVTEVPRNHKYWDHDDRCDKDYNMSTQTLSRWIKDTLSLSGVDVSIFSAHSTRHAATSRARRAGVSVDQIRRTAGWSANSATFANFYDRNVIHADPTALARSILNQ